MNADDLQIFERHFEIHGDKFEYADVRSIRWRVVVRMKSIYFIPLGSDYTYELTIDFRNGAPLDLGIGAVPVALPFSMGLNKRDFGLLENKIKQLQAATRDLRLAQYEEQLRREGFFEYDGKAFYRDGTVEHKGRRRNLDLKIRAEALDASTKFKCLPHGSLEVSTAWDRDCFHAMLNNVYGASRDG